MGASAETFDAVAWLDPPVIVSRRVARGPYAVKIAGRRASVWLPSKGPSKLTVGRGRPADGGIPEFPPPALATPIREGLQMAIRSATVLRERPLIVTALRLRWRDSERAAAERKGVWRPDDDYVTEVAPWLALARDWLSAWLGGTWRSVAAEATPAVRLARVGGKAVVGGGGQTPFGVHLPARRISTPSELRAAFIMASDSRPLPLAHQILAEALAYASAGRGRHAVISACTAAEVALSESLERFLERAGHPEKERDEILGRGAIVDLCRLHVTTGGALPASLKTVRTALASPRNRAAHKGNELDGETVTLALKTAKSVLTVSPLPTPRVIIREAQERG
jgi:hypothetical protein